MGRTTYFAAASLDGFIADEHDSLDWLFVQHDAELASRFDHDVFIGDVGALLMGRTTYEWILDRHVDRGEAWAYPMPTWVLTHHPLRPAPGADVRFAGGDVAAVHALAVRAAAGRDVWIVGGGDLARQVADAGLLDEVIVDLAPVTLGAGRPLLPRRLALHLEEAVANGDFVAARHTVRGPGRWPDPAPASEG